MDRIGDARADRRRPEGAGRLPPRPDAARSRCGRSRPPAARDLPGMHALHEAADVFLEGSRVAPDRAARTGLAVATLCLLGAGGRDARLHREAAGALRPAARAGRAGRLVRVALGRSGARLPGMRRHQPPGLPHPLRSVRRTALVTGGARGIGRAVVAALAGEAWVASLDCDFPEGPGAAA